MLNTVNDQRTLLFDTWYNITLLNNAKPVFLLFGLYFISKKKRLTFKIKFCGIKVLLIIFMYENLYFCIESQLNEAISDR